MKAGLTEQESHDGAKLRQVPAPMPGPLPDDMLSPVPHVLSFGVRRHDEEEQLVRVRYVLHPPRQQARGEEERNLKLGRGRGGGHVFSESSNSAGVASADPGPSTRDLMSVLLRLTASLERRQTPTAAPTGAVPKKRRETQPALL